MKNLTVPVILERKKSGEPIVALTAYDYTFASLIDESGVDVVLVGDSVGSVVQGHASTIPVTLEQMIYHTQCVARGVSRALVVGDLPFLSYQVSVEQAIQSAGRMIKEGGAAAVKLEGGLPMEETIRRIVDCDIPVMGHVGLTPQSFHRMGGHRLQGRAHDPHGETPGSAERILEDARAVARAGAFAVVLEGIPAVLANEITKELAIPTIGIGAGNGCDGQILVSYDLLGLTVNGAPSFAQARADFASDIRRAVSSYAASVRQPQADQAEIKVGEAEKSV